MSDSAAPLTTESTTPAPSSAPETSSAPQTTEQITANVVEQMESETPQPEKRIDTTDVTVTAEKPVEKPITPAELSAAEKFLLKQGHKLKKEDGRDTWLPGKTVLGMLDRYVEEHRNTWTGERSTLERQAKELQHHIESLRASVAGDPKAFLSELAAIDARYQAFLEPQPERRAAPAATDDPMPQPDYDLGNGSKTYSFEGLQKLREWDRRQTVRELEGKIEERFKPIAEREKAEKQRAETERMQAELHERVTAQMQEAQKWPLFGQLAADGTLTEFQEAVLGELKRDTEAANAAGKRPSLTLEGAYIRVASKRMTEDDTAKRARLLKEIEKAPRSTAMTGHAESFRPAAPRTTEDIAREQLARLEKGA